MDLLAILLLNTTYLHIFPVAAWWRQLLQLLLPDISMWYWKLPLLNFKASSVHKFQEVADQAAVTPPAKYKMVQYLCSDTEAFDEGMFCQFDAAKPAAIKQDFARLEKEGSIPRSSNSWLSPLHKMMKEDGRCRPCGDYQHLATKSDTCPLPNIQDKLAHMHGCTSFRKLDLRFYHLLVQKEDIENTAVITPCDLWVSAACHLGCSMPANLARGFQTRC